MAAMSRCVLGEASGGDVGRRKWTSSIGLLTAAAIAIGAAAATRAQPARVRRHAGREFDGYLSCADALRDVPKAA